MRKIIIPATIKIRTGMIDQRGEQVLKDEPFHEFLHDNVLTKMGKTLKETRRNLRIYEKVLAAQPGDTVLIDTSDWEAITTSLKTDDWNQFLAMQVIPYFDAIELAEEVTP